MTLEKLEHGDRRKDTKNKVLTWMDRMNTMDERPADSALSCLSCTSMLRLFFRVLPCPRCHSGFASSALRAASGTMVQDSVADGSIVFRSR
jgi:hypothetical protein